jgi:RNA polymerase sigma-70 factor, ECF subfamily
VPDSNDDASARDIRFHALYQEHYAPIRAYALRRAASADDAADVVAETFTTAWRRLSQIPPPPADRLWLFGVARRIVAGRHRSARRGLRLLAALMTSQGATSQGAAQADPMNARVLDALGRLRPGEREALKLVVWDELSHAEAARVLGCSVNAVGIRVHRAKTHLREALPAAGSDTSLLSNKQEGR